MPEPTSRNWRMPASAARNRTARPRKARFARAMALAFGSIAIIERAASWSARKLGTPPSHQSYTRAMLALPVSIPGGTQPDCIVIAIPVRRRRNARWFQRSRGRCPPSADPARLCGLALLVDLWPDAPLQLVSPVCPLTVSRPGLRPRSEPGYQVSSEPSMKAARGGDRSAYPLPPRLRPQDATSDPARMAAQILDAVVPGFADAAGIYALEQLLSDGAPVRRGTGARQHGVVVRRLATRSAFADQPAFGAAFPSGEVVALTADSAFARCLRDGAPVIFARPRGRTMQRISKEARTTLDRYTSFLATPMITRGTTVGILVLAREPSALTFGDDETQAAVDLAGHAAAGIADSLALMRHRAVAEALEPPRPQVSQETAGRCLPARGCDAGGDWYDLIPLPRERTGLIVGDVMGHGPLAAAVMTRLSAAAYALADLDLPPEEVMRQLNRTALALPQDTLVTCAYAVIDPARESCAITAAGHLPPILALPDGTTRVLDLPAGQSLGVTSASYGEARIRLRPGTILALYSDGLVETRTRPFDRGILAVRSALARPHPDLDSTCEELAASPGETREDDTTIVLARIPPDLAT